MSVPVNLYVDRMSPVEPVRVADVYAVTHDRASAYSEAASKIGLTTREYAEFRQALTDGGAVYVVLPRHIDAMAGVHRSGHVYALRNVVVPSGTMGWQVNLADGTTVLIPRVCGNLSMNHSRAIAARPRVVAQRTQPKAVRAVAYVAPKPTVKPAVVAAAPVTPVTFEAPQTVAPVAAAPVAAVAAVGHASFIPFVGLLAPIVASFSGGGGGGGSTHSATFTPAAPPCAAGSNATGICSH
ncbi:MAG: hypothetical protein ABSB70_11095 [Candidatus Velthaea sp.]|jgi:hypothetical protein